MDQQLQQARLLLGLLLLTTVSAVNGAITASLFTSNNLAQYRESLQGPPLAAGQTSTLSPGGFNFQWDAASGCVAVASGHVWAALDVGPKPGTFTPIDLLSTTYCDNIVRATPSMNNLAAPAENDGCGVSSPRRANYQIDRGHIIAKSLGGDNDLIINMFPQWQVSNENEQKSAWRKIERATLQVVRLPACSSTAGSPVNHRVHVTVTFFPCNSANNQWVQPGGNYIVRIQDNECWKAMKAATSDKQIQRLVDHVKKAPAGLAAPATATAQTPVFIATVWDNAVLPTIKAFIWPTAADVLANVPTPLPMYPVKFRFVTMNKNFKPLAGAGRSGTRFSPARVVASVKSARTAFGKMLTEAMTNIFTATNTWGEVVSYVQSRSPSFNMLQNGMALAGVTIDNQRLQHSHPLYMYIPVAPTKPVMVVIMFKNLEQDVMRSIVSFVPGRHETMSFNRAMHLSSVTSAQPASMSQLDNFSFSDGHVERASSHWHDMRRLLEHGGDHEELLEEERAEEEDGEGEMTEEQMQEFLRSMKTLDDDGNVLDHVSAPDAFVTCSSDDEDDACEPNVPTLRDPQEVRLDTFPVDTPVRVLLERALLQYIQSGRPVPTGAMPHLVAFGLMLDPELYWYDYNFRWDLTPIFTMRFENTRLSAQQMFVIEACSVARGIMAQLGCSGYSD